MTILFPSQSACIHTEARARAGVNIENADEAPLTMLKSEKLEIEHIIYTPSKLPLEDFFSHLTAGELKAAFSRIDLSYQSAKVDDKVLQELMEDGFIPVYVRIQNSGKKPVKIAETEFVLTNGAYKYPAIAVKDLPHTIKRFNPAAAGANIYNAGVVVVTAAVVVGLMYAASKGGGNVPFPRLTGNQADGRVFNEMEKTTDIDYRDYLLKASELTPDGSTRGLLFFNIGHRVNSNSLRLEKR